MSQILPSVSVGGDLSRSSVLLGTQLASTERFQDFLKSYIHTGEEPVVKVPARSDAAQLVEKKDTDTSLKAPAPAENNTTQKPLTPSAVVGHGALNQKFDQKNPDLKAGSQSVQFRSDAPSTPSAEKISSEADEKEVQLKPSSRTEEPQSETPSTSSDSVKNTPAGPGSKDASTQVLDPTPQISSETEQVPSSEPVVTQNMATESVSPASDNAAQANGTQAVDDSLAASAAYSPLREALEGDEGSVGSGFSVPGQNPEQENVSFSVVTEASLPAAPNVRAEVSEATVGSEGQGAPNVETPSAHSNVRSASAQEDMPVITHTSSDSHLNTEIEMTLGEGGKVHVSIDEADDGERRVHIRAENPEVLQSLSDDKGTLFAALNQSVIPISPDQPVIPTDLTLSLMGNFSQSSEDGSGQENRSATGGAEHPGSSSISRNKTQASVQSSRTMLRGVVDLTA